MDLFRRRASGERAYTPRTSRPRLVSEDETKPLVPATAGAEKEKDASPPEEPDEALASLIAWLHAAIPGDLQSPTATKALLLPLS